HDGCPGARWPWAALRRTRTAARSARLPASSGTSARASTPRAAASRARRPRAWGRTAGRSSVEALEHAAHQVGERGLGGPRHRDDLLDRRRRERVRETLVGDDRYAEHLHPHVHRGDDLRHGAYPDHVGPEAAEHPVLGAGLAIRSGYGDV